MNLIGEMISAKFSFKKKRSLGKMSEKLVCKWNDFNMIFQYSTKYPFSGVFMIDDLYDCALLRIIYLIREITSFEMI